MPHPSIDELVAGVRDANRRTIAQAITLVESQASDDLRRAHELLTALRPLCDSADRPTRRVGISGVPGAGKSSLLETLGTRLVAAGQRIAVLAVDPTSARSGGSILGDKTRMEKLSRETGAFIRPTAGGGQLGGVAPRTREAILVCEAAGFDTVFVETIGVGQSESAVRDLVDVFVMLMLTGAGDDLQGIKRGVLELADVLLVTKADGDNATAAAATVAELKGAMHILHGHDPSGMPVIAGCSAHTGDGIDAAWQEIVGRFDSKQQSGELARHRAEQDTLWFDRVVNELLRTRFFGDHGRAVDVAREAVRDGREFAVTAARRMAHRDD